MFILFNLYGMFFQIFTHKHTQNMGSTWEEQQDTRGQIKKTSTQITEDLKITQILDKLLKYKKNWIEHVNRMPRNKLPRVMKHYCPTGRRNRGRPLKRFLDTWDRNGSTSGQTAWKIDDDDDDYDDIPSLPNTFQQT
jgi:hypothetical protein